MSVTEVQHPTYGSTPFRNGVTEGRTAPLRKTGNRNGPEITCSCCGSLAARDQSVYIGTFQPAGLVARYRLPICTPCWTQKPRRGDLSAVVVERGRKYPVELVGLVTLGYCHGEQPPRPCIWCRRPVVIGYPARRVACSDRCRTYARREDHRQARIDYPVACRQCRASMPGAPRHKRFCSDACRQKSYRERVTAKAAKRSDVARLMREYDDALHGGAA